MRKYRTIVDAEYKEVKTKYKQKWSEYDQAKTNEDILFKKLLNELLFFADLSDNKKKRGRPSYSIQDRIFSMAIKIYYNSDLRKCTSILKELVNLNYIQKAPSYKSIDNFFADNSLSTILDDLIFLTAIPLAALEDVGAIDATGFSTSQFETWSEYKWGRHSGKFRLWRKAHAVALCKTNAFIAVEVTEKNITDGSMFDEVVGKRTKFFELESFVADKAYLSKRILTSIKNLGMTPYIPFKKNSVRNSKSPMIWRKMYDEFITNNDKYMKKYHVRSNVETCFHMVKKKFGNQVKTKSFNSNVNEIKIKFLCHNICCLISEIYENKIDINFDDCVKKMASV